jgi:methylenetetrahydrofolate dehydrogenase (NADP+) / methenyltetrahydrofolate cyclohydrolase
MTAILINGREIAHGLRKSIFEELSQLKRKYAIDPVITTIIIGNNPSSALYLKLRDTACKEVGIIPKHVQFDANVSEEKILQAIQQMNTDTAVHGILVQYPVPSHIAQEKLMRAINPRKDVEGFNPVNLGRTLIGDEYLVPCTPLSVLTILEHEHISLKGKDVVIINHSNVVGKPLAALLLNRNATVSICHVFTKNLKQYTAKADILITGAGVPKLITKDFVKDKAIVIDVGIAESKDGICGDVDVDSVIEKVAALTPVPGGVGPVTIACSLINMTKIVSHSLKNPS